MAANFAVADAAALGRQQERLKSAAFHPFFTAIAMAGNGLAVYRGANALILHAHVFNANQPENGWKE